MSNAPTLPDALSSVWRTIGRARRRDLVALVGLMLFGGFAELVTIGAVVPFLAFLAGTAVPDQFRPLTDLLPGGTERLMAATLLFAAAATAAAALRLLLAWGTEKVILSIGHDLSAEIHRRTLLQPYEWHVQQHSSTIISALEKVQQLIFAVLLQLAQGAAALVLSLFIMAALVSIDARASLAAVAALALLYALIGRMTRHRLRAYSESVSAAFDERIRTVQESLGAIRDIIIDGSHQAALATFMRADERLNRARVGLNFITVSPRPVIEAAGMILIALIALALSRGSGGIVAAIPVLGALGLGAQRLLPLVQTLYQAWTNVAGNRGIVGDLLTLLRLPVPPGASELPQLLPFQRNIRVEDVSFEYLGRAQCVLEDVCFTIPKGARVAIVGRTGSGKSTLADLIMGLLDPSIGRILVDGMPIVAENRRAWQRNIAHVPQAIFLADSSIAANIALSNPGEPIDQARLALAASAAQLSDFVNSLPDGFETKVGERGIRLSGGQRQRVGIARALYKQAPLLVLDEATSALDDATERAVMAALAFGGRTILVIAHRASTIEGCDMVVRLEKGGAAIFLQGTAEAGTG